MESLMTSASDTRRCRAACLIAALSSGGRYTVVLSMEVWYHRWRWHLLPRHGRAQRKDAFSGRGFQRGVSAYRHETSAL